MKKLQLPLLLLIFCCMVFIRLAYLSSEKIDQMVPALAGDYIPTIVLDAECGKEDGGAVSKSEVAEEDINLAIMMGLRPTLEVSGSWVVMIQDSDVPVGDNTLDMVKARKISDMHNRLKIIEENGDCAFLSIRQNHFANGKCNGAQIFCGTKNPKSQALVGTTQKTISTLLQPDN